MFPYALNHPNFPMLKKYSQRSNQVIIGDTVNFKSSSDSTGINKLQVSVKPPCTCDSI